MERKRQVEVVFIKDSMECQTFWVLGCLLEEEIFCETRAGPPLAMYSSILRRKMRRYLQTIYTCGRLLSVSSRTKKERTKKMFSWFLRNARVLCGPVLCNHQYHNLNVFFFFFFFFFFFYFFFFFPFFFLVNVILVIHVSYYITVYLNDVKSCIWFGHMFARRRCESQYRKMLYFCYEIY